MSNKNLLAGIDSNFQTPPIVADFMASFLPINCGTVLEPTPGIGNLVIAAEKRGAKVYAPDYFKDIPENYRSDYAIMNPPFTPMIEGYNYLTKVMEMSDLIIALLPWFVLINSEKRLKDILDFGLVSVTHLPRKTFPGCRIQCCILQMNKGYKGETLFKHFTW